MTFHRLTVDQVEELWQCLVVRGSSECADCLYSWLLSHTKTPEQHALGLDAMRFLYIEKMPTLDPEVAFASFLLPLWNIMAIQLSPLLNKRLHG